MITESSINYDEDGVITVKIPLRGGDPIDKEVNAYGTLMKAEKMIFQYFVMEEMKRQKQKEANTILRPA